MTENNKPSGPDLSKGVSLTAFRDGKLLGHVGEEDVLLVQAGSEIFAIEPACSHYHGPLAEGLVVGDTIRCPWHHACFSLRTGEATRPPALNALAVWEVARDRDDIIVRRKREAPKPSTAHRNAPTPEKFVIVGGGAAGFAAAETLRREGFAGAITMLSDDGAMPVDRPNLSKDYLAGNAPEDWLPLRGQDYYQDAGIDLRLNTDVSAIDAKTRNVTLGNGDRLPFDRLLLATGAEPVKLQIPGADQPHVHTLRSVADSRAIIKAAESARRALVIGASFIGLEVAASLRARKIEVHVVAPEERPMQKVLGSEMGDFVRSLHEENGVIFHLKDTVEKLDGTRATLKSGAVIEADLVVVGIGVKPRLALAEHAGLAADRGVSVSEYLETSVAGIFAAGDIARWPDPHSRQTIRVEHWVVAERQGQTAARNMLGKRERFDAVPFFWSQHYDVPINYVGHAESFDEVAIDGSIGGKDCLLKYRKDGRVLAIASIYRDLDNLKAELEMERSRG
ncbi:pyridine nucleotide-disulfide oxidoreductase [Bradyrhizobium ottawaense]|uniref:FAD-dependent oxidoreductase n=1 Tax=Bradyrhizobium TaxID=374 RepID=UPI0004B6FF27|nr:MULTISPECIES: FAD-dependent oxidoreductase [Bradyrhizobium]MDA9417904.1 pyridine nucleotide-disulfide oxidoreductase [Bradyrhizobium sp. CCBAU 25360]MDA9484637.1 pyridine nucleotide-disulfide oxidoreductase [Bradyrhizobium sp. CCBAU 11445]PDT67416.1 pyridine nucleotide-disulfide oxidoreductase [Bradyrhizobium ottawaense]BBO13940.1 pyridine nucleotide-disulfide oxidoreductase [Bradyrhizobium sp. TM102]